MSAGAVDPQTSGQIDADLQRQPFGRLQLRVALLCALVAMLDGFDTQAAAFVAPVLSRLWDVGPQQFGVIFAAGLAGIMAGQLTLGPLADRIGRRPVILLCTALFAAGSLATLFATGPQSFLVLRFLTGIGLGGATPNIIALTAEYAPPRLRATVITSMFAGFPLGAAIGGAASAVLIPAFGWQSVFLLGGLAPLLLLLPLAVALPESPHFLANSGRDPARLAALLQRLGLDSRDTVSVAAAESAPPAAAMAPRARSASSAPHASPTPGVRALWQDGRGATTLLLWLAYLNSLLMIYFLMNWLPTIARNSGLSLNSAIVSSVFLNLGGAVGGILLGRLADRLGAFRVLAAGYLLAAACLALIGITSATAALLVLVFVAGLCTIGGQTAMNAAATTLYPTEVRATALGMALAVGRIGSILGPTLGGLLLAAQWPLSAIFTTVALPALVVCVTALVLHARSRSRPPRLAHAGDSAA